MSFLRSPITAGPVQPSVLTGIFSYQSHCFCVFVFVFVFVYIYIFLFLSSTVLPCPLELTGGLLTNHQCFDLWTTRIYKTYKQ